MAAPRINAVALLEDGWLPDYEARLDGIVRHGLVVVVRRASVINGFVSLELEADDEILPRPGYARPFGLHLTLGYTTDYSTEVLRDAVERLNRRWAGQWVPLRISHYTCGGTIVLAKDDLLYNDEDVWWLHSRGWYGNGRNVDPRRLHISL